MIETPEQVRAAPPVLRRARVSTGTLLVVGGLLAMLLGGGGLLVAQSAAQSWSETAEAASAARQVAAPTPRWIDEPARTPMARALPTVTRPAAVAVTATPTPVSVARPVATPEVRPRSASGPDSDVAVIPDPMASTVADVGVASAQSGLADTPAGDAPPLDGPPAEVVLASGLARAAAGAVEILNSEFLFLDPPEPGAHARLGLQVRNHSDLPTGPLRLTLSTGWLGAWRIVGAVPSVLEDRVRDGGRRTFDYPGIEGAAEATLELHLVAIDDAVDPPELLLSLAHDGAGSVAQPDLDGSEIGRARPETVAPRPRPGPARTIAIPRLGLRAAVVPTTWEPPSFVVGQLRQTANLSEGNTVLIGHLNGLGGNVFARLDQLAPGDEIIATSRGLEYRFVVSEMLALPGDDSVPAQPTDEPRLTLMTCAGDWDPIHLDYSHRLWVVAEPAEQAQTTLSGETPGPLSRQLGLTSSENTPPDPEPVLTPTVLIPRPVVAESVAPAPTATARPPAPAATIVQPADGAIVSSRVVVRGRRAARAVPGEPLWLVVRPEIEGSRWYPYAAPLTVRPDGTWEATLDLGGGPGVRHTVAVSSVDAATDARLRLHVAQRPGQPLPLLPDAFEHAARIVVERR